MTGRRTLEELVDRYAIRHQGVRQLILHYLARRRSELDYSSLDQHARSLAGAFWVKIEALSPGHPAHLSIRQYQRPNGGVIAEGWLGEIEGIDLTLTFLRQKRNQTRGLARVAPVDLGLPARDRHESSACLAGFVDGNPERLSVRTESIPADGPLDVDEFQQRYSGRSMSRGLRG